MMEQHSKKIGFGTATSLVIANMVGTGVFTSLGFQVLGITDGFALMMLWLIGGVISLCGALVYGELGTIFPNSGGEYNYLSKIYHPAVGFLAGWVSATVGFAAPIAMAAMALSKYVAGVFPNINKEIIAIAVILGITSIHSFDLKSGSIFQRIITVLKVAVIIVIIFAGFTSQNKQDFSVLPTSSSWDIIFSGGFAISLYWVTYSYSGWNAAAYMAGEIENSKRNLPRSLFIGTLIVTILYVLLNYIFLYSTPISDLAGKEDIGLVAAKNIFGQAGGNFMGMIIAFLLLSAISAMVMAGPRVIQTMGKDVSLLGVFSQTNKNGVPYVAIILQSVIAITLVITAKFDFVLQFTSFSLNLFTFFTVLGIFIVSFKGQAEKSSRKVLLFFLPAIVFLAFQIWILYKGFEMKKEESMLGLINIGIGLVFWIIAKTINKNKTLN
jgi:APA family basic amino acid/polyamine antiporter